MRGYRKIGKHKIGNKYVEFYTLERRLIVCESQAVSYDNKIATEKNFFIKVPNPFKTIYIYQILKA